MNLIFLQFYKILPYYEFVNMFSFKHLLQTENSISLHVIYQVFLNIPVYEIKTTKSILHVVLYTPNYHKFLTITDLKKLMEKNH